MRKPCSDFDQGSEGFEEGHPLYLSAGVVEQRTADVHPSEKQPAQQSAQQNLGYAVQPKQPGSITSRVSMYEIQLD